MKLFFDDTRPFPDPKYGFECCRDLNTAKLFLSIMTFEFVSFDYSLTDGSGLQLLEWMKENNIYVPRINIHSSNITGRQMMLEYCRINFPNSEISMNMLEK